MRHLFLFLCGILFSFYAFAQNQNIQRIVLTDGSVINGQVEKQDDGTIMVSTTNGDIFFFQPSDVILINGVNQASSAKSQAGYIDSTVKRRGNKLCFVNSGMALTEESYYSPEAWGEYQLVVNKGKTGRVLLYSGLGGLVIGGVGIMMFSIFDTSSDAPLIVFGVTIAAGLGVGVTGLVMTINSNKKLNRLADSYNQNSGATLSFGAQQHGIGFALNF